MNETRGATNLDQRVQAAQKGSLQAFNRLAADYLDDVYTLAFSLTREEQAALEVSQQALAAAYQGLKGLHEGSLRSWLLAKTIEVGRIRSTRRPYLPVAISALQQKLEQISEEYCLALLLVDVIGLNYEEAGWVTGCSAVEIGKRLAAARRHML